MGKIANQLTKELISWDLKRRDILRKRYHVFPNHIAVEMLTGVIWGCDASRTGSY